MKILTFGEILLRLKPPGLERFFQSPIMEASFGGGEANVAVSLANYGLDAAFVTKLPENPMLLFHSQTLVWMCSIALSYQIMSSAMNV